MSKISNISKDVELMRWEMVTMALRWECYHITEFTEVGQIDKYGIELGELGVFWYFYRIIHF